MKKKARTAVTKSGFTLIEILLAVVIMGIILAAALPNFFKGYTNFQLNKITDDLLGISRWAQGMAVGQEHSYSLSFSDDRRSYRLEQADINEETGEQDDYEPVSSQLGHWHNLPDSVSLDCDNDHIVFYPDGTIDPSTIQLNSADQKTTLSSTEIRGMLAKVNEDE